MKTVKKIAALFALMLTTAVWADAPTPVAVWHGFKDLTSDAAAVNLNLVSISDANGNVMDSDGFVTIANRPIQVTINNPFQCDTGYTVLVKYSNLANTTANQVLMAACTHKDDNATNTAYDDDTIGLYIKDANGVLAGIWQHAKWNTTDGGNGQIPASGVVAQCYSSTQPQTQGLGMATGATTATTYYSKNGLAAGGRTLTGFSIGATKAMASSESTNGLIPATGMKIEGVAIFAAKLTADQVAAYQFPAVLPSAPQANYHADFNGETTFTKSDGETQAWKEGIGTPSYEIVRGNDANKAIVLSDTTWPTSDASIAGNEDFSFLTVAKVVPNSLSIIGSVSGAAWQNGAKGLTLITHQNAVKLVSWTHNTNNTLVTLADSAVVISSSAYDSDWLGQYHSFLVTYNNTTQTACVFVDGTKIGEVNNVASPGRQGYSVGRLYGGLNQLAMPDGTAFGVSAGVCVDAVSLWTSDVSEYAKSIAVEYPVWPIEVNGPVTITIDGDKSWEDIKEDVGQATDVTLNVSANATLTLTEGLSAIQALRITGSSDFTIKNSQHLVWANVQDGNYTGKLTYEIGLNGAAPAGLVNKIKTASTKHKFIFTGGATVDLGSWTGTLSTHLVFRGGTHTFKHSNGNSLFGKEATNENPTVMAEESATLNFYGHDLTGWSAAINQTGIIRAASGSTIVLHRNGNGTFYYNQTLVIDPGATIQIDSDLATNDFRVTGGTGKQMIVVMDQANDTTITPARLVISSQLALAKDLDTGMGIYVGTNAKLQIAGTINSLNGNNVLENTFARPIKKTGAGMLEISGVHGVTYEVAAGSIGGDATVQKLSMSANTKLHVASGKAITVLTQATLLNPQPIEGSLVNDMVVITVPSGFDVAEQKASNGGKEYDLRRDGNALKLVYMIPPAFPEDAQPIEAIIPRGNGGKVEVDISTIKPGDYTGNMNYSLKFGEKVVTSTAISEGKVTFDLSSDDFFQPNTVYRGEFVVQFGEDGSITNPIAVYEGNRQFTWTENAVVIKEATTINDAAGCTINPVYNNPDYLDTCDSVYTVSISATEAVDADADEQLKGDEQGGVRIASLGGTLKLQGLIKNEQGTTDWVDILTPAAVNQKYIVTVKFHYSKGEDDTEPAVSYTVADSEQPPATGLNPTEKLKVTEVFISDGTVLPSDLTGLFQLDSAVVVDVQIELEPGHPEHALDAATTMEEAEALAAKIGIKVGETVAAKLTDAQKDAYKGYFRVIAKQIDGHFQAEVVFTETTENELKEEIEKAVVAINTGSTEINAKPGLYYGVKRGDTLDAMNTVETTMATGDKVTITIVKPEESKSHFYRIIVSPTPATTTK